MTASDTALTITDPGPATTVQDAGRHDARRWGVPVAGTLSPDWLMLANHLVGNEANAAVLEFRLIGPRFTVEADDLMLAVGGPAEIKVEGPDGSRTIPPWTAAPVLRGDKIAVGRVSAGTTALLAVSGGIYTPPVLGSRATYVRAALGGHMGRALRPGDSLPVGAQPVAAPLALHDPPLDGPAPIRVIVGPQDDHFEPAALEDMLAGSYTVTEMVDRMGMRLEGPQLQHRAAELSQIASDGIVPGAMQVPGNGQPIVLLADGQTVGGYPKIATVISADLPRLARRAPGETIRFARVDAAEAEGIWRNHQKALKLLTHQARPAALSSRLDIRRLYEANLISGAIDMARPNHFPGSFE
ncbi:5-oxoprolinase subunit C family protein [Roseivivax sp. CAU 1753]